jgi:hypothetical protein
MTIITNRRELITGLISFAIAAPSIVRASSLMPVKSMMLYIIGQTAYTDGTGIWQLPHIATALAIENQTLDVATQIYKADHIAIDKNNKSYYAVIYDGMKWVKL